MTKLEQFRQFISPFIQGKNVDALLESLAEQFERQDQLAIAVTDQLTISTASQEFLEKRLSEIGIIQPANLGMSDDSLRALGISITALKQVTEILNSVLEIFYGAHLVRAHVRCTQPEPYLLEDGMDLILSFEDGEVLTLIFHEHDFENINQATAQEVVDAIIRKLREYGKAAFASVYTDFDTNKKYVEIFGSARGSFSLVTILGGQIQNVLEFPTVRKTQLLPTQTTTWQITRTIGDTLRFRWLSGTAPRLDQISIGDKVMIYSSGFQEYHLTGTFTVTNVRLPAAAPSPNGGWFEIELPNSGLRNSTPDELPPNNNPPIYYYYVVEQIDFDDLKFFAAQQNVLYNQPKYALSFESTNNALQIFLPVTTQVIQRDLIGAAHLHSLYSSTILNGTFGSTTNNKDKIQIINSYAIKYQSKGLDVEAYNGTLQYNTTTKSIASIVRENNYVTVITTTPHELIGEQQWQTGTSYQQGDIVWHNGMNWKALQNDPLDEPKISSLEWKLLGAGINYSNQIINITVNDLSNDNDDYFLGPYGWDLSVQYTLTNQIVTARQNIAAGEIYHTLLVNGTLTSKTGYLLADLGKDTEEGPIPLLDVQLLNTPIAVPITAISQMDRVLTVTTNGAHGAIPGSRVLITGTEQLNGEYIVETVPNFNVYIATASISKVYSENTGYSTVLLEGNISTLIIDPSYKFKYSHPLNSDFTFLSSISPYIPDTDGSDYSIYLTGTANALQFAQKIINDIIALGITLEIYLIFPNDIGLGHMRGSDNINQPPLSDKVWIWSEL